jgi:hypothetical protein
MQFDLITTARKLAYCRKQRDQNILSCHRVQISQSEECDTVHSFSYLQPWRRVSIIKRNKLQVVA